MQSIKTSGEDTGMFHENGTWDLYLRKKVADDQGNPQWLDAMPTQETYGAWVYRNDLRALSGTIGKRNAYNGVSHVQDFPFRVDFGALSGSIDPAYREVSYETWFRKSVDVGYFSAEVSARSFLSQNAFPDSDLPDVDWSALVERVGTGLDGKMRASTNMLVSLAEIGQAYKMVKDPFRLLSRYRHLKPNLTLRELTKASADVLLEYQYGWRNLWNDMKSIVSCMEKARQHAAYLAKTKDVWSSLHASVHDESTCSIQTPTIGGPQDTVWFTLSDLVVRREANFSLELLRGKAFQLLTTSQYAGQYLGTDKLMEALWDIVPFSFCVDWFFDVGRLVALNPDYLMNRHQLRKVGYSEKKEWRAALCATRLFDLSLGGTARDQFFCPSQVVHSVYTRTPGFPGNTLYEGLFGSLSIRNVSSASALVAQRV